MNAGQTIRNLLATARAPAERKAARAAWARETMAELRAAQERADEAWMRLVQTHAHLDDDEFEALPDPPEQAELDAIHAEIDAVVEHDRWPRALYWGDI